MLKIVMTTGLIALSGQMAFAQDNPRDQVIATVNGTNITLGEMIITRAQLPQQYQQLPDDVLFQGILDQLVQQQLLADQQGEEPARVTMAVKNERRSLMAGEAINTLMNAAVSDEALQAAYDASYATAEPEEEYNASHILVATEEEAKAAIARIEGGAEFGTVAQELSSDTSAANGGNLGWFTKGTMVPEFEAAVVALEVGAVSAPVQTQFGWHVIKLDEKRLKDKPTLDAVRQELTAQVQQAALEARIEELKAAATITLPEEGAVDPALLKDLTLLEN
jgi:peptidyl-prolyl cis-trans isomerase C